MIHRTKVEKAYIVTAFIIISKVGETMAAENEKVLNKLKKVGNPLFLMKLMNQANKFIASHQMEPKAEDTSRLFLIVSNDCYEFNGKKFVTIEHVEAGYACMKVSKEALSELATFIGSETNDVNKLFKDLKKAEHVKQYQNILAILDDSFTINLSVSQLVKFAL